MIKCGDKLEGEPQCILYSKDGSKVLGRFPYAKHGGEKGAEAAARKREGAVQFFKKKSLEAAVEQFGAAPVLAYIAKHVDAAPLLAYVAKRRAERGNPDELAACVEKAKGGRWMKPPKGWTFGSMESFWKSVGGSVTKCMAKIEGVEAITDKGAFCAALKDRMKGTTKWRGPEKEKSFGEETEEALEMLEKDEQTEEPKTEEGETPLSDALAGVDLGELERFLEEWGQGAAEDAEPAAEVPPEEAEPAEVEPEPEEEVPEEWDNDFLNLIRVRHQVRQAAIREAVFGPEDEEE